MQRHRFGKMYWPTKSNDTRKWGEQKGVQKVEPVPLKCDQTARKLRCVKVVRGVHKIGNSRSRKNLDTSSVEGSILGVCAVSIVFRLETKGTERI